MSGKPRQCGCKGYRSCLQCEQEFNFAPCKELLLSEKFLNDNGVASYVFCPECNLAWPGWDCDMIMDQHPNHEGQSVPFPGVFVKKNFLSEEEMSKLIECCDSMPWDISQSGRRKQNFGPKANFKKRKLQLGNFKGFPGFSQLFYKKMNDIPLMEDYKTIEQCSLEYNPERGASIEQHIDDCWVWGERVVTINLNGNSVLTLTKYLGDSSKYNLNDVDGLNFPNDSANICVRIPQPSRSLVIMHGPARYYFEHCVLRRDIKERRVCIALREFTPRYLQPEEATGQIVLQAASKFF